MFSRHFAEPLFGPMPSELSIELWRAFLTYLIPSKVMMLLYFTQSIIITLLKITLLFTLSAASYGTLWPPRHWEFFSLDQLSFLFPINSSMWRERVWAPTRAGTRPCHVGLENCIGLPFRIPSRGMHLSLTSLNGFILSSLKSRRSDPYHVWFEKMFWQAERPSKEIATKTRGESYLSLRL